MDFGSVGSWSQGQYRQQTSNDVSYAATPYRKNQKDSSFQELYLLSKQMGITLDQHTLTICMELIRDHGVNGEAMAALISELSKQFPTR